MSNPTRPAADMATVLRRLKNLKGVKKQRLKDWGYPLDQLSELAGRSDADADRVDALLAIVLDRGGYVHDDDDVAAAEKIAKRVGALMTPHAYLVARHKAPPYPHVSGPWTGSPLGVQPISWLGVAGIFGSVFAVIVVVAVVVVLVRG